MADADEVDRPVVDVHTLIERLGPFGAELASDLIGMWLADLDERVEAIGAAALRRDVMGRAVAVHTLRGSSIFVAAERLADDCAEIERRLNEGATIGALGGTIAQLEHDATDTRLALLTTTALQRIA